MDIKTFINQNGKLVLQIALIIVGIFLGIKFLNTYYENDEKRKLEELATKNNKEEIIEQVVYTTESNSPEITLASFVNYCNNKELENAYKMLTNECKDAMFPTIQEFEDIYIKNIYNVKRNYDLEKWSTDGKKITYIVTLYEDILATGTTDNLTQEYCTFIEDENGNYKININNFIYRQNLNIVKKVDNVEINIKHVDVYQEYEEYSVTITNNADTTICVTGNTNNNNIYLRKSNKKYVSINSLFDRGDILLLDFGNSQKLDIKFNKMYEPKNLGGDIFIERVILDYEEYLKQNYSKIINIQIGI